MNKIFTTSPSHSEPQQFEALDLLALHKTPPPQMDYVLPGFLAGTVGGLMSPGAGGKSMWALQGAIGIACGQDLLGLGQFPVGNVVFLTAEDPALALHHRFHALNAVVKNEVLWTEMAERLSVFPLVGSGCDLFEPEFIKSVISAAAGCRLVIVDTLRRFHTRDENSSSDMGRLLGVLEEVAGSSGAAVLFLHHVSKGSALSGSGDEQQASRGSSVLVDNARWQSYLVTLSAKEAEAMEVDAAVRRYFVRWGVAKQNYGPPLEDRWYRRGTGGVLHSISAEEIVEVAAELGGRAGGESPRGDRRGRRSRHGH